MKSHALFFLLASLGQASAAIELPSFFSDGMVLQQKGEARLWGWLDTEGQVSVTFAGKTETSNTNEEGKWEVVFKDLAASAKGREVLVTDGTEKKILKDVLVGEVWIASGQSNMEWTVAKSLNARKEIATSEDPLLRVYLTRNVAQAQQQIDFPGKWTASSPATTGKMTAVGYYFARSLRQKLNVPVGVIECAWGGKPVQAFISDEAIQKIPEGKLFVNRKRRAIASWDEAKVKAAHEAKLKKWAESEKKGRKPQRPIEPQLNSSMHSTIFNGMIAPIAGYGAQGVIWYQGESNAKAGEESSIYGEMLECMITDWRTRWGTPLSFHYVQLANFERSNDPPSESGWVMVQDEMRRALSEIEKSGMAVANDIGAAKNIHPTNKQEVGARLARWALGKDYGFEDVVVSGPLYQGAKEKDGRMVLTFDYSEGMKSRDGGPLKRFEIKAKEGVWVEALAEVKEDQIIVWSEQVEAPEAVRYAWAENPKGANLVNGEDLPASCFTTEK